MQSKQHLVSIVIPLYNEEKNVGALYDELARSIADLPYAFEIVLVDDGSDDHSAEVIQLFAANDKRVRLVQLSRNFGKEAAVSAGLSQVRGDAAIIMDADLQMPPALVGDFLTKWEGGAEVVVGVFAERNMSRFRRFGARWFYRIMQIIAHTKITPNATDFRLLDRQVIDAFNALTEHNRITRGMIDWLGFKREYIPFKQRERQHGEPNYSFKKLVQLAMNSVTAYSFLPLKLAGYLGVFILLISIPLGALLYVERYVLENPLHWAVTGTTMLAVLNLFLIGVVLACMGLISLYIAHIHTEVVNKPLYIIRKNVRVPSPAAETAGRASKEISSERVIVRA